jgi:uncharacterized lipoprotein YddW (UPF0748 family)
MRLGFLLPALALLVAAGCSRDVELPPAPCVGTVRLLPAWTAVTNAAAAKAVFRGGETPPVRLAAPGVVAMPVDFSGEKPPMRASWDVRLACDLSRADGLQFDFYCSDLDQFASFSCYFKSGDGWYHGTFCPEENGRWQRVKVMKSQAALEGRPDGWDKVSVLRISGWRAGEGAAVCAISNIAYEGGEFADVVVVCAESVAAGGGDEAVKCMRYADRMATALRSAGLAASVASDRSLDGESLANASVVVLPYNPSLPAGKAGVLKTYVAGGGRLLACNAQSEELKGIEGARRLDDRRLGGVGSVDVAFLRALVGEMAPALETKMAKHDADEAERRRELRRWLESRPSRKGEKRAFWCHSARGLGALGWDATVKFLREQGFNMIIPNLCWGGVAFYPSKVLPVSGDVAKRGDAFEQCRAACRKHGVEMHVWKVCWNMGHLTSPAFVKKMKDVGRTQVDARGKAKERWLCPSHPDNQTMEIEAMVELAKMGPDGIHFDYIRYPGADSCFCGGCRARFEAASGAPVEDWPAAVRDEKRLKDRWNEFRRSNITRVVRAVSERVRREAPGIKISAALMSSPGSAVSSMAQDWPSWCEEGLLDFACHMDYVNAAPQFRSQVRSQMKRAGKVPLLPGIGLSCWPNDGRDAERLARQIEVARKLGLKGFTVFNLDHRAERALPLMRLGVTKED